MEPSPNEFRKILKSGAKTRKKAGKTKHTLIEKAGQVEKVRSRLII